MTPEPPQPNTLRRSVVILMLLVVNVVYLGLAIAFGGHVAIETYNVFLLAASTAVVMAYTKDTRIALSKRVMDGSDVLTVGIWSAWLAVFVSRALSIVWRLYDKPSHWADHPLWGGYIVGSLFAVMCHLLAPQAVAGRVPTRQWIRIGIWTGIAVGVAAGLVVFNID